MNKITAEFLRVVSDFKGSFQGAFNIRENGECAGRQSSKNIKIDTKKDLPGIDIHIQPGTLGETVYIPACVTHTGVDDLVYNDFFVGAGADVVIVAGCGVHNDGEGEARHNGFHRFFLSTVKSTWPMAPAPGQNGLTRSRGCTWRRTPAWKWTRFSWAVWTPHCVKLQQSWMHGPGFWCASEL